MIDREKSLPRAYEVMDEVLDRGDAVELARSLSVGPKTIRAWCRQPETAKEFATGKFGPLDRIRTMISMVKEDDGSADRAHPIGHYIARLLGGVFVPDQKLSGTPDDEIMQQVSSILKETGEAIETARTAWFVKSPGIITAEQEKECVKEINEAVQVLIQFRSWVQRKRT